MKLHSSFDIALCTDTIIVLLDRDVGMSVTNDAHAVIAWLDNNVSGGIGRRRVYYRDTMGRFDELKTKDGVFVGFRACTTSQQEYFRQTVA